MKRGLVLTLTAAMVAAMAGPALAVVDVQLNLRYTDPNNPTGGGTWDLLAKSGAAQGLAGLKVAITGNLGVTGVDTPLAAITPNTNVFNATTSVFKFTTVGGKTEIALGDDLAGPLVTGVGTPTFALNTSGSTPRGRIAEDDLFPTNSTVWDNSTLLASGSWTGARPTLLPADVLANEFNGSGVAVAGTIGNVKVRGDSVGVDGLKPGDANRDGVVNGSDFALLGASWQQAGGWGNGNFNSSANVDGADFALLGANWQQSSPAPALAAVPEPASAAMVLVGMFGLGLLRRNRQAA